MSGRPHLLCSGAARRARVLPALACATLVLVHAAAALADERAQRFESANAAFAAALSGNSLSADSYISTAFFFSPRFS